MYEVNYNGPMSCQHYYFYCHIQPERLLYDAERDLLVIAKFLVCNVTHPGTVNIRSLCLRTVGSNSSYNFLTKCILLLSNS